VAAKDPRIPPSFRNSVLAGRLIALKNWHVSYQSQNGRLLHSSRQADCPVIKSAALFELIRDARLTGWNKADRLVGAATKPLPHANLNAHALHAHHVTARLKAEPMASTVLIVSSCCFVRQQSRCTKKVFQKPYNVRCMRFIRNRKHRNSPLFIRSVAFTKESERIMVGREGLEPPTSCL
jgi:hypothetical protein